MRRLVAAGGLPERNKLLMQIYADVTNHEDQHCGQPPGTGGGCCHARCRSRRCRRRRLPRHSRRCPAHGPLARRKIQPIPEHVRVYDRLYSEYKTLYDYFGRGQNDVMKRLRALRREALTPAERAEETIYKVMPYPTP